MSEQFNPSSWYAAMREAGQDVFAIEFVEHDLQLVVTGRSYDHACDQERWAALVDHRAPIIAFLTARQPQVEAA
jgi:hypothetical protein